MNIKDFINGQQIEETFAVLSVKEKLTKDGKPYLNVTLSHPSGKITGTVFSEAIPHCYLKEYKLSLINARVQNYNGSLSLLFNSATKVEGDSIDNYLPKVPTLVFDIETVGIQFEKLEKSDQEYLLNNIESNVDPEDAKLKTALHPIYGFVTYIGMLNPDTGKGKVIGTSDKKYKPENKNFVYENCKDEKELLENFWQIATQYEQFVTYNGRVFDIPYLVFRSLINKVTVSVDINGSGGHIDLQNCFRPYGTRAYKLEAIAKSLGVTNPKEKGVSGLHVSKLYEEKKYQEIIDYVSRDAVCTTELYKLWRKYAPVLV